MRHQSSLALLRYTHILIPLISAMRLTASGPWMGLSIFLSTGRDLKAADQSSKPYTHGRPTPDTAVGFLFSKWGLKNLTDHMFFEVVLFLTRQGIPAEDTEKMLLRPTEEICGAMSRVARDRWKKLMLMAVGSLDTDTKNRLLLYSLTSLWESPSVPLDVFKSPRMEAAQVLLDTGADINARTFGSDGITVLQDIVRLANIEVRESVENTRRKAIGTRNAAQKTQVIKFLLEKGADPLALCRGKYTAFELILADRMIEREGEGQKIS